MSWARVAVKDHAAGVAWCYENLTHNDWVCGYSEDGSKLEFRFRDPLKATEFALRF
jgi:hypothetical protein